MPWIQIKINTSDAHAEPISELLIELGAISITFQDTFETPIFEPLPGEIRLWANTDVIGLFPIEIDTKRLRQLLSQSSYFLNEMNCKIERIEDKDWVHEGLDRLKPLKFGNRLWICPSWLEPPDNNAINVILDPGLAFGTGMHPTTSLCLNWLDGLNLDGKTIIDYGCGSGILAIAAIKLGAKKAIAVDIDPQALEATLENAQRNNVNEQISAYLPSNLDNDRKVDLIVANILASPLISMAPHFAAYLKQGGLLALSGIFDSQTNDVVAAYEHDFILDEIVNHDEWCRVSGIKRV